MINKAIAVITAALHQSVRTQGEVCAAVDPERGQGRTFTPQTAAPVKILAYEVDRGQGAASGVPASDRRMIMRGIQAMIVRKPARVQVLAAASDQAALRELLIFGREYGRPQA